MVALACFPWAAAQAQVLWGVPHYRFLPIVPLAAAALAVRGSRTLGPLAPGWALLTFGLLAVAWLLAAGADVMYSPALGTVATLAALAALAHGLGGVRLLWALVPAGIVLALAVRPPLRLDYELSYRLQTLATVCSSRALDMLGVYHLTSGHVVEIPGHRLYVEEACSGITSLFVVLSVTLCAALWGRRGPLATLALLAAAAVWVLLGNVVRITTGAYLLARWGVDVTSGWTHEALGLLVLVVVLGLIASTDRVIAGVGAALRWAWDRFAEFVTRAWREQEAADMARRGARRHMVAEVREWRPKPARPPKPSRGPTRWPAARDTWVATWPVVAAFGVLGLANGAAVFGGLTYSSPALTRRLDGLVAGDLPETVGELKREAFRTARIGKAGTFGSASRQWSYRPTGEAGKGLSGLVVEVDDPYVGWHEVTDCYKAKGWVLESRKIVSAKGVDRVVAKLTRPLEGEALVVFSMDDARGEPLGPPSGAGWRAVLGERLTQAWWRFRGAPRGPGQGSSRGPVPSYMVQVLVEADHSFTEADERAALALLDGVRDTVRRRVRPNGGG
jgi:exosortase